MIIRWTPANRRGQVYYQGLGYMSPVVIAEVNLYHAIDIVIEDYFKTDVVIEDYYKADVSIDK